MKIFHHEAWEDHAERGGGSVQYGGPQEHKDVHAALQQRLKQALVIFFRKHGSNFW
jgi:hypothetical protein